MVEILTGGLKFIVKASVSKTTVRKEVATALTEYVPAPQLFSYGVSGRIFICQDGRDTRTKFDLFLLRSGFLQNFLYQKDLLLVIKAFTVVLIGFVFTRFGFMDNRFYEM